MVQNEQVARRWYLRQRGLTEKPDYSSRNRNFYGTERALVSYGDHFPMVEPIRTPKNEELIGWLVNGDVFSMTTRRHQSTERQARSLWGGDLPSVTIPFSALDAAGIIRSSVRIVEVTTDRNIPHRVVLHEFPEGAVWHDDEVVDEWGTYTGMDAEGNLWVDRFIEPEMPYQTKCNTGLGRWGYSLQYELVHKLQEADRKRRGYHSGHYGRTSHFERNLYVSKRAANSWRGDKWTISIADDGATTYTRTWNQHLLGESLITAEVAYRTTVRCDLCNGTGRADAPWRDEWEVRRYESAMKDWEERKARDLPVQKPVSPMVHTQCSRCGGRKRLPGPNRTRRAYFLSGFDHNEPTPSYFFCELPPKARPTTVAEAYDALKPEAVKIAEQMGRPTVRQGDIFAVVVPSTTKRALTAQGARYAKRGQLLGTNHVASEVAYLPDGTTMARGILVHAPQGRRPDHKRQPIGKDWAVIVKNTVPLAR